MTTCRRRASPCRRCPRLVRRSRRAKLIGRCDGLRERILRWLKWIALAVVLVVLTAACVSWRPDRALRVATGVVAHNVCSKSFVSGLDPPTVFSETIERDGLR